MLVLPAKEIERLRAIQEINNAKQEKEKREAYEAKMLRRKKENEARQEPEIISDPNSEKVIARSFDKVLLVREIEGKPEEFILQAFGTRFFLKPVLSQSPDTEPG
jgi:hypothetical protein